MNLNIGRGSRAKRLCAIGVAAAVLVAGCGADPGESAGGQSYSSDANDLAAYQAETDQILSDLDARLTAAEAQIDVVTDQLAAAGTSDENHGAPTEPPADESTDGDWSDTHTTADATVEIFGDGNISCPYHHAATDWLPVGTVSYQAAKGEIRVTVNLTTAEPDWTYANIELWDAQECSMLGAAGTTLTTDANGSGEVSFVVSGLAPGTYRVNINVASPGPVRTDTRYREMGGIQFVELVVG